MSVHSVRNEQTWCWCGCRATSLRDGLFWTVFCITWQNEGRILGGDDDAPLPLHLSGGGRGGVATRSRERQRRRELNARLSARELRLCWCVYIEVGFATILAFFSSLLYSSHLSAPMSSGGRGGSSEDGVFISASEEIPIWKHRQQRKCVGVGRVPGLVCCSGRSGLWGGGF